MLSIRPCPLPRQALLAKYAKIDACTDCYTTELARSVSHAAYVEAFYTGALFEIEQLILGRLLSMPSTDFQARQLAAGYVGSGARA